MNKTAREKIINHNDNTTGKLGVNCFLENLSNIYNLPENAITVEDLQSQHKKMDWLVNLGGENISFEIKTIGDYWLKYRNLGMEAYIKRDNGNFEESWGFNCQAERIAFCLLDSERKEV